MLVDDDVPGAGIRDDDDDDSNGDSSDDEGGPQERRHLHRILNYIETTVNLYDGIEFRKHFRIKRPHTYALIGN